MTTRIKLRRDTAANWTSNNPILAAGEPGLETDTGKIKYGDGVTAWADLPHAGGDTLTDDGSVVVTAGSTEHWIAAQRRDGYNTEPRGLRYDSEGNLYALTRTAQDQDSVTVITKYTAAGAVAWQKSFFQTEPTALAIDSNDCAYITFTYGDPVLNVIKFSTTGSILWKKSYDIGPVPIYSAFIEEKSSTTLAVVAQAADGGPPVSVLAMEISSTDGSVSVKKTLALESPEITVVTGIDVDGDENVFVSGHYYDSGSDLDKMFIEKLDQNLDRVWSKLLEAPDGYNMTGGDCASDAQGNVYAVGAYSVDVVNQSEGTTDKSAAILVKLNSSGTVQWTRRIGPGPCGSFVVGLTATDVGDVYLSSTTYANKTDGGFAEAPEGLQEILRTSKQIVARYNTLGAVIWQRYVDVVNLNEESSDFDRGQAVAVFGSKFAVDGYGFSTNNPNGAEFSETADNEQDYFVVQLPTDGTELTIGNLSFTESRVAGRFVTHEAVNSSLVVTEFPETILAEDSDITEDDAARIANNLVNSETYTYTFGADGTLTIPNDGDVKLTQSQVGYLMAIGTSYNNSDDIIGRATCVDSQGYLYVGGDDDDNEQPFVMKISPTGDRLWGILIEEDDNGDGGRVNALSMNPASGNLMVLAEMYGSYTYSILVTLDQDTGRILDSVKFSDTDDDVLLLDIAWNSEDVYVLGGEKRGDFSAEIPVTAQTGSTTGSIRVLRSDLPAIPTTNWQIGGTGISPFENILYLEQYTGLTGTVRQGSGATFTVQDNGDTTYSYSVTTPGTNYLPGHKIRFLGSTIGGVDGVNDAIFTVATVDGGGVTSVTVSGTAAGTGPGSVEYQNQTGTNIDTGSGFELTFQGPFGSDNYASHTYYNATAGGTNYVEHDIVVIPGTSLGGTSPANDLTVRVSVSGGSVQYLHEATGTAQSTTWKLDTTTQVDFSGSGSWSLTYPMSMEGLVVTPTWQRTFNTGIDIDDTIYSVAVDSGDNIIAVGRGYGELNSGNFRDLALVFKFNSTGTLQWVRQLNEVGYDCWAQSVVTIGTDIYVVHNSNDDGDTVITKLDSTGTVKWQRKTQGGGDACIARTANGNLMVIVEEYHEVFDDDAIKVIQMTDSGETVYKRWLSATTNDDTFLSTPRGLCVDNDSFYIGTYFDTDNYDAGLAVRLPLDGSGTGEYGSFSYQDVNDETNNWTGTGLANVNYNINIIDIEGENNYTGALTVAPTVSTGTAVTTGTGLYYVNSWYPDLTIETIHDTDGGSIVFADGSKQSTSATDIPQRRYFGQRYMLGLKDRGHHILCDVANDNIVIPYNSRVPFPIGSVITVVNTTSSTIGIGPEGGSISVMLAGNGNNSWYIIENYGVVTLLKIGEDQWVISGNVTPE